MKLWEIVIQAMLIRRLSICKQQYDFMQKKDLYRREAKKYVSVEDDKYEDSDVKVFTVTERVGQD